MKRKLPIGCKIPEAYITKGISYLEIHEGDGGLYLVQHDGDVPKWDSFYNDQFDLDDILQDCKTIWNIDPSSWKNCPCTKDTRSPESDTPDSQNEVPLSHTALAQRLLARSIPVDN